MFHEKDGAFLCNCGYRAVLGSAISGLRTVGHVANDLLHFYVAVWLGVCRCSAGCYCSDHYWPGGVELDTDGSMSWTQWRLGILLDDLNGGPGATRMSLFAMHMENYPCNKQPFCFCALPIRNSVLSQKKGRNTYHPDTKGRGRQSRRSVSASNHQHSYAENPSST